MVISSGGEKVRIHLFFKHPFVGADQRFTSVIDVLHDEQAILLVFIKIDIGFIFDQ